MYVVGADENGLGPRLGPMIATAVTLEVEDYGVRRLQRRGEALGIADSKLTSGFGRMAVAESLTLALAERELGHAPPHLDALFGALGLDGPLADRAPCPDATTARQCFAEPMALPAYGGEVEAGREVLRKLEGRRVLRLVRVRTAVACVGTLNAELALGRSKWTVDLALFERLMLDAAAFTGSEVEAVCGMVGGIRHYADHTTHFTADDWALTSSDAFGRTYALPRVGQVRFEIKADRNHLPVALASMVGKYVRELTMGRIVRFYRAVDPELPEASGYHDPVTRRFIERASGQLPVLGVRDACFRRQA